MHVFECCLCLETIDSTVLFRLWTATCFRRDEGRWPSIESGTHLALIDIGKRPW